MYVVNAEQCAMSNLHEDSLELAIKLSKQLIDRQPITNNLILDMLALTSYVKSAFDNSPIEFGDHNEPDT